MKMAAVVTEDFSVFHTIVYALKRENIPFITLSLSDPIPRNVGVVITSPGEESAIRFSSVVVVEGDTWAEVARVQHNLSGKSMYETLVIGIDPGPRPGLAVLGDLEALKAVQLESVEEVVDIIHKIVEVFISRKVLLRVGHGDTLLRNRLINSLMGMSFEIEVVDETRTSVDRVSKGGGAAHTDAALSIALSKGRPLSLEDGVRLPLEPTSGELKEIQRRSRIASKGRFTISSEEARSVAIGERTLQEAVENRESGEEDEEERKK